MDPVRILQILVDYLNEHAIDGEALVTSDDPEGDNESAEVRISWGGKDLFDLTINRI